jgi:hypothetical protein
MMSCLSEVRVPFQVGFLLFTTTNTRVLLEV